MSPGNLVRNLLVRVQCRSELFLLLLDMLERLIDVVLFLLGCRRGVEERSKLYILVSTSATNNRMRAHVVTVLDEGAVPHSHLGREPLEFARVGVKLLRPRIHDLFDSLAFECRWGRNSYCWASGCRASWSGPGCSSAPKS